MVQRHAYKELHLKQLRGFCETARLGSLSAAADALGLSQPTVWEQVRALERAVNAKLIEAHGRGCRLTEDGRLLAQLVAPLVAGIESLGKQFEAARQRRQVVITLASTPRVLTEDLPGPLDRFRRAHPNVRIILSELRGEQIAQAVEAQQADIGIGLQREPNPPNPWLTFEPAYELEPMLITPKNHPLARRRQIRPEDLSGYPLINSPQWGFPYPAFRMLLEKLGVFELPGRAVEASFSPVIRRYVEAGFGIGIVVGLPGRTSNSGLHERSLSRHFGRVTVNFVWRKGSLQAEMIQQLMETIRDSLREAVDKRRPKSRRKQ